MGRGEKIFRIVFGGFCALFFGGLTLFVLVSVGRGARLSPRGEEVAPAAAFIRMLFTLVLGAGLMGALAAFGIDFALNGIDPKRTSLVQRLSQAFSLERNIGMMIVNLVPLAPLDGAEAWRLFSRLSPASRPAVTPQPARREEAHQREEAEVLHETRAQVLDLLARVKRPKGE